MAAGQVFFNYRRSDSQGTAGRLADALSRHFGPSRVFMDVGDIAPGTDFTQVLEDAVASAAVMLVVIGPRWLESAAGDGRKRLDNPDDFVRVEIESALNHGLPMIPVLVDGAEFPSAEALPPSLAPITRRQAIFIRNDSFQRDIAPLLEAVEHFIGRASGEAPASGSHGTARSPAARHWPDLLDRFGRWLKSQQEAGPDPSTAESEVLSEDETIRRLQALFRRARTSNIPLAKLLASLEEVSCDVLGNCSATEDLYEHIAAFPAGRTLPIIHARLEILYWDKALKSNRPAAFVAYLVRFPHGTYAEQARQMRDRLIAAGGGFDAEMPRVFLNYRRVDSQDTVDRIYAILSTAIPPQNIVMDVDKKSIVPGLPVETQLKRLVDGCDVMLALIHNRWLEELEKRRAQHEAGAQLDYVRAELKHALARGEKMPVVPVLCEGVAHPQALELPQDIRDLARRSSVVLSRENFDEDVLELFSRLSSHHGAVGAGPPPH